MKATNDTSKTNAPSIWEEFEAIINDCAMYITHKPETYPGTCEVEGTTPEGGDMLHTLEITDPDDRKAIAKAFDDMYEEFDPWREAHLWLDEEGNPTPRNGIFSPTSMGGRRLVEDVDAYDEELKELNGRIWAWAWNGGADC